MLVYVQPPCSLTSAAACAPGASLACRHIWTGYRPYGEVVRGFLKQHREQQPAQQEAGQAQEGSSGGGSGSANGPRLEGGLPLDPDACECLGIGCQEACGAMPQLRRTAGAAERGAVMHPIFVGLLWPIQFRWLCDPTHVCWAVIQL